MRAHAFALPPRDRVGLALAGLAIGCLWYLDALTTAWALGQGAVELGPFARVLVAQGYVALLAAKLVGLGLVLGVALLQSVTGRPAAAHWGLAAVGSLSIAIVVWNLLAVLALVGALPL